MIVRARPMYYEAALAAVTGKVSGPSSDGPTYLYFNLGRTALKFLLDILKQERGQHLTVGLQSFNCDTVVEAILHSGNICRLLDVDRRTLSLDMASLEANIQDVDVLLLTHYQGIVHPEYQRIHALCRKHHVFLIDDAAQTEHSTIHGIKVGDLGDVKLESYAFDKPFSAYEGGALVISASFDIQLKQKLVEAYSNLPEQDSYAAGLDLQTLQLCYELTHEDKYQRQIPYVTVRHFLKWGLPPAAIRTMFCGNWSTVLFWLVKLAGVVAPRKGRSFPDAQKLASEKIELIRAQRQLEGIRPQFDWDPVVRELGLDPVAMTGLDIYWNRYSVLDLDGKLKQWCTARRIEASNYNWPQPLHRLYAGHAAVQMAGSYPESDFCSENVVNLPVWTGRIAQ